MHNTKFQKELLATVAWQILPTYAQRAMHHILANKQDGISLEDLTENLAPEKTQFFLTRHAGNDFFEELVVTENAPLADRWGDIDSADEVINVIVVDGAITRNGGACSVCSKQHCEQLIAASQMPNCIGHIFLLNSPGGAASSVYDYERGINAVHEAGQPCIGLIDNLCASACTRLSAKLDEVYYVHEKNQIGCIGTMAVYTTNKNGDENSITHEVYHEVYADASSQKNGWFRQSAEGDDSGIKEELNRENDIFLAEMRQFRPRCTEEILSGPLYDCKDMEGILVDGKSDFEGCVNRILELRKQSVNQPQVPPTVNAPSSLPCVDDDEEQVSHNTNTTQTMDLKFKQIQSIIGEQEGVTEEGFFLNEASAQALDDKLAENAQSLADAEEKMSQSSTTIAELDASLADVKAEAETIKASLAEAQQTIADLTAKAEQTATDHAAALAQKDADHEAAINELNETLAQKDAEIEALSHAAPVQQTPVPATAEDGETDGEKKQVNANIFDRNLSREEMIAAFKEREALLKR